MTALADAGLRARRANGVPVKPLADAFRRSGMSAADVAGMLDWWRPERRDRRCRSLDGSAVLRTLGLLSYDPGHGYPRRRREFMTYDMALKMAEAIGADPVDVGL